jgi:glycerol-3-phosphate dehydrogenase (NAD(P)+)
LWARDASVAEEINRDHTNKSYLPGFPLSERLRATVDLEEATRHAELLIVGVPTSGFRGVLEQAKPYVHPWIPIVSLSKGFETGSLLRMTEVIADVLPGRPAVALTGPNLAREIMSGQAAASVIATTDLTVANSIQTALARGVFRLYTNHDVIGAEVAGALKNVVALATGMAQGLGVGDNTRATVIARGLAEITRLGVAMGGEPATFAGLAGLGDLVATCVSPLSRNRTVGEELGKGRSLDEILASMNMVAEGVRTASTAVELAKRYGIQMPIAEAIEAVIDGKASPLDAYRGLLRRPPGHEHDPE